MLLKVKSSSEVDRYYEFSQYFLSLCGNWPYQDRKISLALRSLWSFQHIFIMACKIAKITEITDDNDILIEAVASWMYNLVCYTKWINGVVFEKKIRFLMDQMKSDWKKLTHESEIEILRISSESGRLTNLGYILMAYSAISAFLVFPFVPIILDIMKPLNESRPRVTLLQAKFFIDEDKYFFEILAFSCFFALCGIIPLLGADCLYMSTVYHANAMTKLIGTRVMRILDSDITKNRLTDQEKYDQISECALRHQEIIEFCNNINGAYSSAFFIVLFFNIICISITGVTTVLKLGDMDNLSDLIRFGMFNVAQVFHILCYNYFGQTVQNSGEILRENMWCSDWHTASIKIRESLRFMLMRSKDPIVLRARIFPLSLPTFTSVMKTSMSYYTILKSTT